MDCWKGLNMLDSRIGKHVAYLCSMFVQDDTAYTDKVITCKFLKIHV